MKLNYASFMLFYLMHVNVQNQRDSNCSYAAVFLSSKNGRRFLNKLQEKLGSEVWTENWLIDCSPEI